MDAHESTLAIIGSRKWDKALFTSYTLSLSFFESYLVPLLRSQGCAEIALLVDVDGYRSSLIERRSRSVGQEYSLIPVAVRNGIFHPKVVFLQGPEGDLLLVGSGNLTFGGYGRNLEVIECLEASRDAAAFEDFAEFCESLLTDDAITVSACDALESAMRRARQAAVRLGDRGGAPDVRLLHSLERSFLDQLISFGAKDGQRWDELLVLSPFHHPAAAPIKTLVKRLGVKKLLVGVPPNGTPSPFPFGAAERWDIDIDTVRPVADEPARPLHAKWFELRGIEAWALTGSVNATEQSLATCSNVEVAVLRRLDTPTTCWAPAMRPAFQKNEYDLDSRTKRAVIYAELNDKAVITGRLLGVPSPQGVWQASLELADTPAYEPGNVEVDTEGRFSWAVTGFKTDSGGTSPQLRLERDGECLRGWLAILNVLRMTPRARAAASALGNFLRHAESLEDMQALLDIVSQHTAQLARAAPETASGSPSSQAGQEAPLIFSPADLVIPEGRDNMFAHVMSQLGEKLPRWGTVRGIARLLLGKPENTKHLPHLLSRKQVATGATFNDEDEEDADNQRKAEVLLDDFNAGFQETLGILAPHDARYPVLLDVWGCVSLRMHLSHYNSRAAALDFAWTWLSHAVRAALPAPQRDGLNAMVYGLAAALALRAQDAPHQTDLPTAGVTTPQYLHQLLENWCGNAVDSAQAQALATEWLSSDLGDNLVLSRLDAAVSALAAALATKTERGVLADIIDAHERGLPPNIPEGVFSKEELKWLRQIVRASAIRPAYEKVDHRTVKCCRRYHALQVQAETMARLRGRRIAQCVHCNTILVSLKP